MYLASVNTEPASRFRLDSVPTWLLLLLSGALLGLAYPPNPLGIFGSIGLAPLLVAMERARTYRQAIRWSYWTMLIFSALSSWWIGSWQARTDTFLMISCVLLILIHPLFFVVPMVIYRAVRRSTSRAFALLFFPFLWCGGEYLHALGDASYPWLTLGNTLTYNLNYIQFIEFTGVWGLSFLLLVHNVVVVMMLFAWKERRRHGLVWGLGSAVIAVSIIVPTLYGWSARDHELMRSSVHTLGVTIVQPNVDPWDKWDKRDTTDQIALSAAESFKAKKPTDMFLWVETAVPTPVTAPGQEGDAAKLQRVVDSLGVPLLTGFPDYLEYADRSSAPPSSKVKVVMNDRGGIDTVRYDYFNSAGLFVPHKGLVGAYHKMQLVPFGERIPYVDNVPWLIDMLSWGVGISAWGKGQSITTMHLPYRDSIVHVASVICFESVYPNMVRKFVDSGANFMTIITNDGWYLGTPGPLQHERIAIMRAVETRRDIARAANTGISCFVSAIGDIHDEAPENVRTTVTGAVEPRDDRTLYVEWGDWWPQLCLTVAGGMIVIAVVLRLRRRTAAT